MLAQEGLAHPRHWGSTWGYVHCHSPIITSWKRPPTFQRYRHHFSSTFLLKIRHLSPRLLLLHLVYRQELEFHTLFIYLEHNWIVDPRPALCCCLHFPVERSDFLKHTGGSGRACARSHTTLAARLLLAGLPECSANTT